MHPKRPNPKIPKNRKKCIFFKKSIFSKWPADHHGWSKTGPNDPPKCSKHISSQYMAFISILDYFLKNRKKLIFENFFRIMHQQNRPNFIFPAEIGQILSRIKKTYWCPFQKNFFRIHRAFSGFYHKKYLHRPIWPKPNFWHLGRFGYKKASKM